MSDPRPDAGEQVVLVDDDDRPIGAQDKLAAHRAGQLHRAFSLFVVDGRGRHLLQRRAAGKYHSGGLWTNTCCGHPRPGEDLLAAARRRLGEEMGVDAAPRALFVFRYRAELDGGLIEHEIDHVLAARHDGDPRPAPDEVAAWRWDDPAAIAADLAARPERYTVWFRAAFARVQAALAGS